MIKTTLLIKTISHQRKVSRPIASNLVTQYFHLRSLNKVVRQKKAAINSGETHIEGNYY